MRACVDLVNHLGGEVAGLAVLIELSGLGGRQKMVPIDVHAVLQYE
jgi:adenine/guanine phosphoribosyltransferase-like PRPP-binding protein